MNWHTCYGLPNWMTQQWLIDVKPAYSLRGCSDRGRESERKREAEREWAELQFGAVQCSAVSIALCCVIKLLPCLLCTCAVRKAGAKFQPDKTEALCTNQHTRTVRAADAFWSVVVVHWTIRFHDSPLWVHQLHYPCKTQTDRQKNTEVRCQPAIFIRRATQSTPLVCLKALHWGTADNPNRCTGSLHCSNDVVAAAPAASSCCCCS